MAKKVMMNMGMEPKYDKFEQNLKAKGFEVIRTNARTPEEIIAAGKDCEVAVVNAEDQWNLESIEGLKDSLKLIARFGVGLDNIDVRAAWDNSIMVANAVGANKESVAEFAVTLMLATQRRLVWLGDKLRSGVWKGLPRTHQFTGHTTVGLVGFGAISKCVARMLGGFNCKILAYDIFQDEKAAKELGVTFCDMDQLLAESDFVSLHTPLNQHTHHMVNAEFLAKMKPTAILINTSRGGVVCEEDLYKALTGGVIRAAGLDVFESEPPAKDNPLFTLDNVTIAPHAASATEEGAGKIAEMTLENVCTYFETGTPKYLVR